MERRQTDKDTYSLIAETRQKTEDLEKTMSEKIDDLKDELDAHIGRSESRHKELTDKIEALSHSTLSAVTGINQIATETHKLLKSAIPNGDADGHRKAHERWIKKDEQDEKFWYDIKRHAVQWVVVAVLGWAGLALWTAFLKGPG